MSNTMNKVVAIISLLLMTWFGVGCERDYLQEDLIQTSRQAIAAGDYRLAVIKLKSHLARSPNSMEGRWMLGKLYVRLGDGVSAAKELQRMLELGGAKESAVPLLAKAYLLSNRFQDVLELELPDAASKSSKADLYTTQGMAAILLGQLNGAQEKFAAAHRLLPDDPYVLVGEANLAVNRGQHDKARILVERSLSLDDRSAQAWSLLGRLKRLEGDLKGAREAYTHAIQGRYNNFSDRLNRSQINIQLKDSEAAKEDLIRIESRLPNHPMVKYTRGLFHFYKQEYELAKDAFEQALVVDKDYLNAIFYMGTTDYKLGNLQRAGRYLEAFVTHRPESTRARKILALVKAKSKEYAQTEMILAPVLKDNPKDIMALNLMGIALLYNGETDRGLQYLEQVVKLQPDSAEAKFKLGTSLISTGKEDPGIAMVETAIELNPSYSEAALLLFTEYYEREDFASALKVAERFKRDNPASHVGDDLAGMAYLSMGQQEKAITLFKSSLAILPGNPSALHNLASCAIVDKQYDKAKSYYQQLLSIRPNHSPTLIKLADLHALQGNEAGMRAALIKAVELNPDAVLPRVMLAKHYILKEDAEKAAAMITPIKMQQKNNPEVLAVSGEIELLDNPRFALQTFRQLVTLTPSSAKAHYLLGKSHAALGQTDEALSQFDDALALNSDFHAARMLRARIHMRKRRLSEAAIDLDYLQIHLPDDPETRYLMAEYASAKGNHQEAADMFQRLFEKYGLRKLMLARVGELARLEQHDQALEILESWLLAHPQELGPRLVLAEYLQSLGLNKRALSEYEKVYERSNTNLIALNNMAWMLRNEDPARAVYLAEQAYSMAPRVPDVIDTLSVLVAGRGDLERGLSLNTSAINRSSDEGASPAVYLHRAQILVAMQRREEARSVLEKLLNDKAEFAEREDAISLLEAVMSEG